MWKDGIQLHSRAYQSANTGFFGKDQFVLRLDDGAVVCPAGKLALIQPKSLQARFDERDCRRCPLKTECTTSTTRTIQVHPNEDMLEHFRKAQQTRAGRLAYRERTAVEHQLGRIDAIQGHKARYKGVRKNELDLRRTAAVANLQEVCRIRSAA